MRAFLAVRKLFILAVCVTAMAGCSMAPPLPGPAETIPVGRMVDRTALWEQVGGDLLYNFNNMYNLDIVVEPEDEAYPFKGWFFGWAADMSNTKYPGCDAIFAARAPAMAGPWEVYAGRADRRPVWDTTMTPALWVPVIAGGTEFYNNWHNGDPSVIRLDGGYFMAYSATGFNTDGIGHGREGDTDSDISVVMGATSDDGLRWKLTKAPLLVEPSNIGGKPKTPKAYGHPRGNYHRPSLMFEKGIFKIWFDCIDTGKPMMTLYAENDGDFSDSENWKILRGMDNSCIIEWPNPDVIRIEDVYFSYSDPGSYASLYGDGWVGRQTAEAVSLNGRDWLVIGHIAPDADVQANQIPEATVVREEAKTFIYLDYGGQIPGAYQYDRIRMKRREVTDGELERYRDLCKGLSGPAAP